MTLLDALQECRFVDLSEPLTADPMFRSVLAWRRSDPERLGELYRLAEIPPPASLSPLDPAPKPIIVPGSRYVGRKVASSVIRVYGMLSDYRPHRMRELTASLHLVPDQVSRAVHALRARGVTITARREGRFVIFQVDGPLKEIAR